MSATRFLSLFELPIGMEGPDNNPDLIEWEMRGHVPIARVNVNFIEWIITTTDNKRYRCSGSTMDVAKRKAEKKGLVVANIEKALTTKVEW